MPSTFPEAFGMVAAEAAACGALPVSAAHSGLAEVTATLAGRRARRGARELLSFALGPGAVARLADRLVALAARRPRTSARATRDGARRASPASAAPGRASPTGVIAAAQGDLRRRSPPPALTDRVPRRV